MFESGVQLTKEDHKRLKRQIDRIFALMSDGKWRSVSRITEVLGYPEPSVSAQLRNLRKARHGAHTVSRRRVGNTYEYQIQ